MHSVTRGLTYRLIRAANRDVCHPGSRRHRSGAESGLPHLGRSSGGAQPRVSGQCLVVRKMASLRRTEWLAAIAVRLQHQNLSGRTVRQSFSGWRRKRRVRWRSMRRTGVGQRCDDSGRFHRLASRSSAGAQPGLVRDSKLDQPPRYFLRSGMAAEQPFSA